MFTYLMDGVYWNTDGVTGSFVMTYDETGYFSFTNTCVGGHYLSPTIYQLLKINV